MKAAVWTSEYHGPALVAIPRASGPADMANIPNCPAGAFRHWASKGDRLTWAQWMEHLAGSLPLAGQWSVQEVPDGLTAVAVLRLMRERVQARGLTPDNPSGTVGSGAGEAPSTAAGKPSAVPPPAGSGH